MFSNIFKFYLNAFNAILYSTKHLAAFVQLRFFNYSDFLSKISQFSACFQFFKEQFRQQKSSLNGVPTGIRTPVTAVKGRCPRPLDDGDNI